MFLYSHTPLNHVSLEFVMKYVGYRFQSASLNNALNHAAEVFWFTATAAGTGTPLGRPRPVKR